MANKGIILAAFGRKGYGFAAYNMALSIKKFNKNIPVVVFMDQFCIDHLTDHDVFDNIILLSKEECYTNEKIDPAKVKIKMVNKLPFEHNLYLDVDGLAMGDVETLLDTCIEKDGEYFTDVRGIGGINEKINYSIWASNKDIWDFFDLNESTDTYIAVQSSWAYFKRKQNSEFIKYLNYYFDKGFPLENIKMKWGGTLPDELIFGGAAAKAGIDPTIDVRPIFFGNTYSKLSITEIREQFLILSIYGNGKGNTLTKLMYIELYDRIMLSYMRELRRTYKYKSFKILNEKHTNFS